jgi:hypothetical protein
LDDLAAVIGRGNFASKDLRCEYGGKECKKEYEKN